MTIGRPSIYSDDLAATICHRIAEGESLRSICRDDAMPDMRTVLRWLASETHEDFRRQYTRAREAQADTIFDEILDIADDASNDWMVRSGQGEEPGYALNGEHVQRSKLRIDARKWMAGKLAPKKYGEKISQEITGADGAPLVPDDASPQRMAQALLGVLAKAGTADD